MSIDAMFEEMRDEIQKLRIQVNRLTRRINKLIPENDEEKICDLFLGTTDHKELYSNDLDDDGLPKTSLMRLGMEKGLITKAYGDKQYGAFKLTRDGQDLWRKLND